MKTLFAILIFSASAFAQYSAVPSSAYPTLDANLNTKASGNVVTSDPATCQDGHDLIHNTASVLFKICGTSNAWTALQPLLTYWGSGSRPVTANALGTSGNCMQWSAAGAADTGAPCAGVTSISTTSPITGGTITSTGTIACATCVTSAASLTANQATWGAGLQGVATNGDLVDAAGTSLTAIVPITVANNGGFTAKATSGVGVWIDIRPNASGGAAAQIYTDFSTTEGPLILGSYTNRTNQLDLQTSGNITVGGTTDGNYRFDVQKSGSSGTLRVKDQTATIGATKILFDLGAADTNTTNIFTINGTQKFGGNNTTAVVAGAIGTTCPAVTCTAAYTWIQAVSADGSAVYFPVWK